MALVTWQMWIRVDRCLEKLGPAARRCLRIIATRVDGSILLKQTRGDDSPRAVSDDGNYGNRNPAIESLHEGLDPTRHWRS